jgi:segregation and condensation protein B
VSDNEDQGSTELSGEDAPVRAASTSADGPAEAAPGAPEDERQEGPEDVTEDVTEGMTVDVTDHAVVGALGDARDVAVEGDPAPPAAGLSALPEDLPPLPAALEAVLLVTDEPVPAVTLAQVVERPTGEVEDVLGQLAAEYADQGRGFELRQVAGGWRLYTRADCAPYVERFVLDGQQARLTQAALETLAVIAYRQPVTRQRVSAVRGVNVDGVVRTLLARGLVTEAGADEETGATRYRTTTYLLERLGLQSLDELPSLAPLLPELDDISHDSSSI